VNVLLKTISANAAIRAAGWGIAGSAILLGAPGARLNDFGLGRPEGAPAAPALQQFLRLSAAALAGFAVAAACRGHRARGRFPGGDQTPVLLCVAGALMTIVIGNSLPRALGLAGGASIIRFRTPLKDPRNAAILFALLALGAACGLGAFEIAAIGTLFLCLLARLLGRAAEGGSRTMLVELVSGGADFPSAHVQGVFARYGLVFETREFLQGSEAAMKYSVTLDPNLLKDVSAHLLDAGAGIKSVAWQTAKTKGGGDGL
jgi:hypothetical protein